MVNQLRDRALALVLEANADLKAQRTLGTDWQSMTLDTETRIPEPKGIPGRPPRPELVTPAEVPARPTHTPEGRAALIHALAHIELNAIDLALDAVWRFNGMPEAFYMEWLHVARDEARHFKLLCNHLQTIGYHYGDFPAHRALWDMAERTRHDVLARMALVPRTLEARGLDAAPPVRQKLAAAGDLRGAAIIDTLLTDEVTHVAIGNHWFRWLCTQRDLDPRATYRSLAHAHRAPALRGPFNLDARRAAGFDEEEMAEFSPRPRS